MFLNRLFCLGDAVVKLFPIGSLTLPIGKSGMCPMGIRRLLLGIYSHDRARGRQGSKLIRVEANL